MERSLECALAVKTSRQEILDALEIVSESDTVTTEVSVEVQGLLAEVSKPEFTLMATVAVKVLSLLSPANRMMQAKSCNIMLAAELVTPANADIKQQRTEEQFEELATEAGMKKNEQPRIQHTQRQNKLLTNYLVT